MSTPYVLATVARYLGDDVGDALVNEWLTTLGRAVVAAVLVVLAVVVAVFVMRASAWDG